MFILIDCVEGTNSLYLLLYFRNALNIVKDDLIVKVDELTR